MRASWYTFCREYIYRCLVKPSLHIRGSQRWHFSTDLDISYNSQEKILVDWLHPMGMWGWQRWVFCANKDILCNSQENHFEWVGPHGLWISKDEFSVHIHTFHIILAKWWLSELNPQSPMNMGFTKDECFLQSWTFHTIPSQKTESIGLICLWGCRCWQRWVIFAEMDTSCNS